MNRTNIIIKVIKRKGIFGCPFVLSCCYCLFADKNTYPCALENVDLDFAKWRDKKCKTVKSAFTKTDMSRVRFDSPNTFVKFI